MRSRFTGAKRFRADALSEAEILGLQNKPDAAADHLTTGTMDRCRPCLNAEKEQRAVLEQVKDLLSVALVHGHAVTLRPDTKNYDVTVEIEPNREEDTIDRTPSVTDVDPRDVLRRAR